MFGIILIIFTAVGYKLIYRTKFRDPQTVDLQTGRRPLGVEETKELDEYKNMPPLEEIRFLHAIMVGFP
jgi:hypothetical protein